MAGEGPFVSDVEWGCGCAVKAAASPSVLTNPNRQLQLAEFRCRFECCIAFKYLDIGLCLLLINGKAVT